MGASSMRFWMFSRQPLGHFFIFDPRRHVMPIEGFGCSLYRNAAQIPCPHEIHDLAQVNMSSTCDPERYKKKCENDIEDKVKSVDAPLWVNRAIVGSEHWVSSRVRPYRLHQKHCRTAMKWRPSFTLMPFWPIKIRQKYRKPCRHVSTREMPRKTCRRCTNVD